MRAVATVRCYEAICFVGIALPKFGCTVFIPLARPSARYKLGQLTILKLRYEDKAQLGNKFDIKAFHDETLNGGAMPLDLLQERVEAWIKEQASKT